LIDGLREIDAVLLPTAVEKCFVLYDRTADFGTELMEFCISLRLTERIRDLEEENSQLRAEPAARRRGAAPAEPMR